jgi:hypothetical protein
VPLGGEFKNCKLLIMKDKTAIQDAIEKIEKMISIRNFQQWEQLKKEFMLKEKEQIGNAFRAGEAECEAYWCKEPLLYAEDENIYYTSKYDVKS